MTINDFSRRNWIRSVAALCGAVGSGWLPTLAAHAAQQKDRKRSCILLWMAGGPSQTDTFDPKPKHKNGGPFKAIETSVPGIRIGEHLPQLARQMDHLVPIRSMSTKEGDHARGTHLMRTGYALQGAIRYPTLGAFLSKELSGRGLNDLPDYVSIGPPRGFGNFGFGSGYLGPRHAPFEIGQGAANRPNNFDSAALQVKNLKPTQRLQPQRELDRRSLLETFEAEFAADRPDPIVQSRRTAYRAALRMMQDSVTATFDLEQEPKKLRERYGLNLFGQGCLLARRLIERGVPFVEVALQSVNNPAGNWDSHQNNFEQVKNLCGVLDPAWSTLVADLKDRGLLDSTLLVWMGEFGRTPKINGNSGRDHFPTAWSTVLGGGGISGGQVVGRTSKDGMRVEDSPVSHADLLATVCQAVGVDPMEQNMSAVGRPIRLVDPEAKPIQHIIKT